MIIILSITTNVKFVNIYVFEPEIERRNISDAALIYYLAV